MLPLQQHDQKRRRHGMLYKPQQEGQQRLLVQLIYCLIHTSSFEFVVVGVILSVFVITIVLLFLLSAWFREKDVLVVSFVFNDISFFFSVLRMRQKFNSHTVHVSPDGSSPHCLKRSECCLIGTKLDLTDLSACLVLKRWRESVV
jgi:hypothetical protein